MYLQPPVLQELGNKDLEIYVTKNQLIDNFHNLALVVGRITPQGVNMLGSGFVVSADGLVATTHHCIGNDTSNLVVLLPRKLNVNDYQDISDTQCEMTTVTPIEIDPSRDIAIMKTDLRYSGFVPPLGNLDSIEIDDPVNIFGYPHCTHGRRAFTSQVTRIGAKVLMDNLGIKSKQAVINIQSRPGQSGSPVVAPDTGTILGMLIGAWVPGPGGMRLGDINPYELHQTTHCISAGHIKEML